MNYKYLGILLATGLTLTPAVALAERDSTPEPSAKSKRSEKMLEARCKVVTSNIGRRSDRSESNKKIHVRQYQALKENLARLITRLKDKGYDVAQLQADAVVLDGKIATFSTDYATYIAALEKTKEFTCGRSEGEFKDALTEARALLKVVKEDAANIRSYLKDTIKPEIKALKMEVES